MRALQATPWAGVTALVGLLVRSGALRHPLFARDAARRGLPGVIALAAARNPASVALLRGDETITAGQLETEMRVHAATVDLAPGTRVGVRSDGGIPFVVTLAAALDAGLDAVPLGARISPADVATLGLRTVLEPRRASASRRPEPRRPVRAGRLLLLTTGTTGAPVATARGGMGLGAAAQLADADRRIGLPLDGPLLLLAPPDHGHGLSAIVGALLRGIPVILASGLHPSDQAALLRRHEPASISAVPAQLARLLEEGGIGTARIVVSGSSPLGPGLRARLENAGARVHDGFGATATGTVAIDGRPLAGVRMRRSTDGSLAVRSPLGGPSWVSTGDLVDFVDGRLVPTGRAGPLVDSGGELLDPTRLHRLLAAHPGVMAAQVLVMPDDLLGVVLHARVDADPALEPELRAAIADGVGRAEHPRRLEFGTVPVGDPPR
jgi:acyl-CoA synthetase (AMP-forming)/AMP-acid ligase II